MVDGPDSDVLLTGFDEADFAAVRDAIGAFGRRAVPGDAVNDASPALVLAAAYDETSLRGQRAAALDDRRPWCFCVPASNRGLVAAASFAREGRMLLIPPEGRELKRLLSALAEDARERGAGDATFSGLVRLEAEFSWKTSGFEVSQVCRRIAQLLAQAGFYADRAGEDECALALEEALVNSIEHGNLALDSALRPDQPLAEDIYEAERDRRLADPVYGGKLIGIRLSIADGRAEIVLEDQGEGFDTTKMDEGPSGLGVSGKGFWLIRRPFDAASYNEKGNSLTLSKRRHSASPNDAPDSWR
jgi:anti-sigma regulatory factor (Ser/Thr protein kinase)